MRKRTSELLSHLQNANAVPENMVLRPGEISDGMIDRSPLRKEHIYNVLENLYTSKHILRDDFSFVGLKKSYGYDKELLSNDNEMLPRMISGSHRPVLEYRMNTCGKVECSQQKHKIFLNTSFDPNNIHHINLLAHELGHAVNFNLIFMRKDKVILLQGCATKHCYLKESNGSFKEHYTNSKYVFLGECVNEFNTQRLLENIYGETKNLSIYRHGVDILEMLSSKYNLQSDILNCDEYQSAGELEYALSKKTKVNSPMALVHTPLEVLDICCENQVLHTKKYGTMSNNAFDVTKEYFNLD